MLIFSEKLREVRKHLGRYMKKMMGVLDRHHRCL